MSGTFADAKQRLETYDEELMLGQLCWFFIPDDTRVDHTTIVQQMQIAGLDEIALPPVPRPSDVFKRVCTSNQRKKVPTANVDVRANYMIREVGKDRDTIWRRIVRELVDTEGHNLTYDELYELEFNREKSKIKALGLTGTTRDKIAEEIVGAVQGDFKTWINALTSYSVRELIRHILDGLHATSVRPAGGVYFVGQDKAKPLAGLDALVNNLSDGCSFVTVPVLDDSQRREVIKAAYEAEGVGEIDRLIGEITEMRKAHLSITSDRYAQIAGEFNRLTAKMAEYSDLLDMSLEEVASRLEIFQESVMELLGQVKD